MPQRLDGARRQVGRSFAGLPEVEEGVIKNSLHPAVIAATLVVFVAAVGFFLFRGVNSGPEVQGVESMPPNVRKAFMSAQKGGPKPPPNR